MFPNSFVQGFAPRVLWVAEHTRCTNLQGQPNAASAWQLWSNFIAFVLQHFKVICAFPLPDPNIVTKKEENCNQDSPKLLKLNLDHSNPSQDSAYSSRVEFCNTYLRLHFSTRNNGSALLNVIDDSYF